MSNAVGYAADPCVLEEAGEVCGSRGAAQYALQLRTDFHKTPRVTPAMAAGLGDHVRPIEEIVVLLDAADTRAA
jgi:hypothetical protein